MARFTTDLDLMLSSWSQWDCKDCKSQESIEIHSIITLETDLVN